MKIDNKYKLPCNIFELKVIDTLDFDGEFILTVEEDAMKTNYLSYLVGNEGNLKQRAVIAISNEYPFSKLEAVTLGEISLYDAYNNAENGVVFICEYGMKENIISTYVMSCEEFTSLGLISKDYQLPIYYKDGTQA